MGLSSSTVSRRLTQASVKQLRTLQERDLSELYLVAVFLDGKTFAAMTMVVTLGITLTGEKQVLGYVETRTENEQVVTPFLQSLCESGLDRSLGLLGIMDGGKGLRAGCAAGVGLFGPGHRCQWHKRENVVQHLPKGDQATWRTRLQRAYVRPTYAEARKALHRLQQDLEARNQSAVRSLAEGLEETLALMGASFKTTNCLESIHALVEGRYAKMDRGQHRMAWPTRRLACVPRSSSAFPP
jgi:transposase-like protein